MDLMCVSSPGSSLHTATSSDSLPAHLQYASVRSNPSAALNPCRTRWHPSRRGSRPCRTAAPIAPAAAATNRAEGGRRRVPAATRRAGRTASL